MIGLTQEIQIKYAKDRPFGRSFLVEAVNYRLSSERDGYECRGGYYPPGRECGEFALVLGEYVLPAARAANSRPYNITGR